MSLNDKENGLQFLDAYIDDGRMFFSAENFNGLFCLEAGKSEAEFLGHFEKEKLWQKCLHRQVIGVSDYLYFIPFAAGGVSIYNKKSGKITHIEIKEKVIVSRAFLIDKKIYMIPYDLKKPFLIFDTENNSYEVVGDLYNNICSQFNSGDGIQFGLYSSLILDKKLYLNGNNGRVLCVDIENKQVNTYQLPKAYKIRNMYFDRGVFYLVLSDKYGVVRWDLSTGYCREYKIKNLSNIEYHPYMTILRWNEHLLLLPDYSDKILELNEKTDEWCINTDFIPPSFKRGKKEGSLFAGYKVIDDRLVLFPHTGNGMIVLSENGSGFYKIDYPDKLLGMIEDIPKYFIKDQIYEKNMLYENEGEQISLGHYLEVLIDVFQQNKNLDRDNVGMKIWNTNCH